MSELTARSEYVYSTLGLDPDLGELVEVFVHELPQRVSRIRSCWDQADMEGLALAVHQLKGAAGGYGFETLTPVLRRLDHSIRMSRPAIEISNAIEDVGELCSWVRSGAPK